MPKNTIEITLIASKKSGILPVLMRKVSAMGLIYRRCNTVECDDGYRFNVVCEGVLDEEKTALIQSIEAVSYIDSVVNVVQTKTESNEYLKRFSDRGVNDFTELNPLRANDAITQDVMHIAEDRLAEIFGPSKNLLLKSAAKKSDRVGELFLILAKELNEDQKNYFLRDVEGLENIYIS